MERFLNFRHEVKVQNLFEDMNNCYILTVYCSLVDGKKKESRKEKEEKKREEKERMKKEKEEKLMAETLKKNKVFIFGKKFFTKKIKFDRAGEL